MLSKICNIAAFCFFALATFGIGGRFNLVAAGFALLTLGVLIF